MAGLRPGATMPYLASRNSTNGSGSTAAQLLPGQNLAANSQIDRTNAPQNGIPALDQVGTPRIHQHTKPAIAGVGGEHVANQLVRSQLLAHARQFLFVEYLFEISIAAQHRLPPPTGNPTPSAWPRTACCPASCRLRCDRPVPSSEEPAPATRTPGSSRHRCPAIPAAANLPQHSGQQKMFISSASELIDESSSFQPRSLLRQRRSWPACVPSPSACAIPESPASQRSSHQRSCRAAVASDAARYTVTGMPP